MKCPYCGAEMERGYVQGARGVFWTKKKKKFLSMPGFDDIEVAPMSYWLISANENSYLCRRCNKIIIDLK